MHIINNNFIVLYFSTVVWRVLSTLILSPKRGVISTVRIQIDLLAEEDPFYALFDLKTKFLN